MPTYAGVTLIFLTTRVQGPSWAQTPNIVVRHIPYANRDDVQSLGLGNPQLHVTASIADDADMATLQAAVGTVARTLGDYQGTSWTNTYLIGVANPTRAPSGRWHATLDFMRGGT